ncbi:MAG: hypothetical protein LBP62_07130 [Clostridiales bacterium]|jgi:hypothetical protein|nr:hypothetical protein [Clostridiales bacterium]
MKNFKISIKKTAALAAALSLLIAALVSCQHSSPKSLARAYVTDYKAMNAAGITGLYRHENDGEREEFKEALEKTFGDASESEKTSVKSAKFKGYEKTDGNKNSETGVVKIAVKTGGNGGKNERNVPMNFVKIKNKWYIKKTQNQETQISVTAAKPYETDIATNKKTSGAKNFSAYAKANGVKNFIMNAKTSGAKNVIMNAKTNGAKNVIMNAKTSGAADFNINTSMNAEVNGTPNAGKNVKDFFENFGERIKNAAEKMRSELGGFLNDAADKAKVLIDGVIASAKKINSGFAAFAKKTADKVKNFADGIINSLQKTNSKFAGFAKNAADKARTVIDGIINSTKKFNAEFGKFAKNAADKARTVIDGIINSSKKFNAEFGKFTKTRRIKSRPYPTA